ncbi:MAG: cation acetate symporter [Pseudonocardiaceae bacterium]
MIAVALVTVISGLCGARTRSTSDFLVASRAMGPRWNGAAISGEYLSAASFLGIAGLVLKEGVDALWYPVGFTAGYLALLLFVAAPLRRSGVYTLPDFAEERLGSARLRQICTGFVLVIGWLYLVPQLQGAGLTVAAVLNRPQWEWVGAAAVVVIVTFNSYTGWMRSTTVVQAFQYWIKLTALAVPVFVLLIHHAGESWGSPGAPLPPSFAEATQIRLDQAVVLHVSEPISLKISEAGGVPETVTWPPGEYPVREGTTLHFDAGSRTPVISGAAVDHDSWLGPFSSPVGSPLLATYSLVLALMLGAMGLPHVLGRYYTNPDGLAARKTTLVVLALLGIFYLFPMISGWLARRYLPSLLVTGNTDAAVLLLPLAVLHGWPAQLLCALLAAGAFAAFVSAASGLVTSISGVLSSDILPGRLRSFRVATLAAWPLPLIFALAVSSLDLAQGVGLAFAVAASSFCPLLVLGIWWRGLTDIGAAAGLVAGGGSALLAVLCAAVGVLPPGWQALLAQPAVFTVPLAFLTMVVVSRQTKDRVPIEVTRILLRLHAPDRLGLTEDRDISRLGMAAGLLRPRSGRHRR